MRYKGDYRPQEVLDYDTGKWDVMDEEMRPLMAKRNWVSMSREREIQGRLSQESADAEPDQWAEVEEELVTDAYHTEYPHPVSAQNSGLSVLDLHVPGVLSADQLREQVDLDAMKVTLGKGTMHTMNQIYRWKEGSVEDPTSIMGLMAELAACAGPMVAREAVVDLRRE